MVDRYAVPPEANTSAPRPPVLAVAAALATTMWLAVPGVANAVAPSPTAESASATADHVDQSPSLTASTRVVTVGGLPIAYRSFGRGPTLLLTPCLGFSMDDWDPALPDRLAATNRVVIFDSDGVGRTPASSSPVLRVPQLPEEAAGLIQALHLDRPTVVGYSLAAFVAQPLAVDHPEVVGALILVGTSPGGSREVWPDVIVNAPTVNPLVPADQLPPLYFSGHPEDLAAWRARTAQQPDRVGVNLTGLNRQRAALNDWLVDPTANVAGSLSALRRPTLILGPRTTSRNQQATPSCCTAPSAVRSCGSTPGLATRSASKRQSVSRTTSPGSCRPDYRDCCCGPGGRASARVQCHRAAPPPFP